MNNPCFYEVKLLAKELKVLDSKCRPEIQSVVNMASQAERLSSAGISEQQAVMVSKIVSVAIKEKRLTFVSVRIRKCPACGRRDGYCLHKRSGRYYRRGEPDPDRPILISAFDFDRGFVVVQNSIWHGWCDQCDKTLRPILLAELKEVEAELPKELTGEPSRFRRYKNMKCSCGWKGHEGEMGKLPGLMSGYYPGKCPKCGAKNLPLSKSVIVCDEGYSLVRVGLGITNP